MIVAEISVLKKSPLEAKKKYGLSDTEQYIYDNKKAISKLKSRLMRLQTKLSDQASLQDGFRTIIVSNSKKISQMQKQVANNTRTIKNTQEITKKIDESNQKLQKDIASLQKAIKNLPNKDLVTKKQMIALSEKLLKEINANKSNIAKLSKTLEVKQPQKAFKNLKNEEILEQAKNFITKGDYDSARTRITYLLNDTKYERARVLFFFGELEYQSGNYKKATEVFKMSGSMKSNSTYMPILLLHGGISFQKLGDNESAKAFFNALIDNYPKHNLVKSAQNRLKQIEKK